MLSFEALSFLASECANSEFEIHVEPSSTVRSFSDYESLIRVLDNNQRLQSCVEVAMLPMFFPWITLSVLDKLTALTFVTNLKHLKLLESDQLNGAFMSEVVVLSLAGGILFEATSNSKYDYYFLPSGKN